MCALGTPQAIFTWVQSSTWPATCYLLPATVLCVRAKDDCSRMGSAPEQLTKSLADLSIGPSASTSQLGRIFQATCRIRSLTFTQAQNQAVGPPLNSGSSWQAPSYCCE